MQQLGAPSLHDVGVRGGLVGPALGVGLEDALEFLHLVCLLFAHLGGFVLKDHGALVVVGLQMAVVGAGAHVVQKGHAGPVGAHGALGEEAVPMHLVNGFNERNRLGDVGVDVLVDLDSEGAESDARGAGGQLDELEGKMRGLGLLLATASKVEGPDAECEAVDLMVGAPGRAGEAAGCVEVERALGEVAVVNLAAGHGVPPRML